MALALILAACGGERQPESGTAGEATGGAPDTAAAPVLPGDTAVVPDSAAPVTPPAGADANEKTGEPAQTAQAEPPPKPEPKPTPKPEPKPAPATSPGASGDTQTAQRPSTPSPAPAPADTQQQPAQQPAETAAAPPAPPQENAPLRDAYHQAPKDTVTQVVYDGWKQYNLNCARCHGEDVLGTTIAPHLIVSMKPNGPINTQESFVQVVCAGRPEKGMPSWCALGLEMDKINAIYAYVKGRSAGEIGPGRPAVKQEG